MLSQQEKQFSAVFYARHRQHVIGGLRWFAILLTISGTAAGILWVLLLRGQGNVFLTSVATAICLVLAWAACMNVPDLFRARLLPYFERRVGQTNTWLAGKSLLWHSRRLDAAAAEFDVRPLSEFASGDDMVQGENLCWFSSEDGLRTTERLTQQDAAESLPVEVVSDLVHLRDALRLASEQGVDFCLLLREGSGASGHEMDQRRGSFF